MRTRAIPSKFAAAFIEAEIAAWERGEFETRQALEHSDVVFQNINGTVFRGWDEHKKAMEDTKASYNGAPITQEWRYLMGEGNMFAVSYVWTIQLAEEWGAGSALPPITD